MRKPPAKPPTPTEVVAPPEPIFKGRVALYVGPDERLVLSIRLDGEEEDRHMVLPSVVLQLIGRQLGVRDPIAFLREARELA